MSWDRIFRPNKYRHDDGIRRDALSIGVAFLVNIGWGGTITALGATLVGSAILGGIGLGLSFLAGALFTPKNTYQADPQQRQATVRQSVGPRVRYYGRVKVGGTLWFFDTAGGALYNAITINEGRISAFVEYWLNDRIAVVDGMNRVASDPYVYLDDNNVAIYPAHIYSKLGTDDETVYPALTAAFAAVTEAHRLRGVASILAVFDEVPSDDIANVYPQFNPQVRAVIDASIVKSVRTGSDIWSDNPADCIYDYLTGRDGADVPWGCGYAESRIDLASFQTFADMCDEIVPLKGGGFVKRYRIWGGFSLTEKHKEVLPRMLAACDGELFLTSEGKIAIRGGVWRAPELILDDMHGHIIDHEFGRGAGALAAFNELTVTYLEPNLDYQEAEAQLWVDADNQALIGRPRTEMISLQMVPSHSQARRLAKIHTAKNNPRWQGRIVTNFYGMNAIGERTIRIRIAALEIDEDFAVRRLTILPDMTGVELQVSSLSSSAYDWDAELEEGTAPGLPPDTSTPIDLPPPEDFAVTVKERTVSGSVVGLYLEATWTEPDRTALGQQVQYRISPDGDWFNMSVSDGVGLAESGIIEDGEDYDIRVRTRSPAGANGDWIDPYITVNASV